MITRPTARIESPTCAIHTCRGRAKRRGWPLPPQTTSKSGPENDVRLRLQIGVAEVEANRSGAVLARASPAALPLRGWAGERPLPWPGTTAGRPKRQRPHARAPRSQCLAEQARRPVGGPRLLLGGSESRHSPAGTDMLTSAFAESTRPPRPAAVAYAGPDDGRLLAVGGDRPAAVACIVEAIVSVGPRWRSSPWHCASALGGASEGRPARMQSCGQRRAATIGAIQMSPTEWRDPRRSEHERSRPALALRRTHVAESGHLSQLELSGIRSSVATRIEPNPDDLSAEALQASCCPGARLS